MHSERILPFTLSKLLSNDELENIAGAGVTFRGTGHGGYSRPGGFEGSMDVVTD